MFGLSVLWDFSNSIFKKAKKTHLVVFHRLLIDWGSFCKIPYRMLNEVCTCVTFNVKFGRGLNYTQLKKKVDGLRVFIVPASFTAKNPPNELRVYSSSYTCLWHSGKIWKILFGQTHPFPSNWKWLFYEIIRFQYVFLIAWLLFLQTMEWNLIIFSNILKSNYFVK